MCSAHHSTNTPSSSNTLTFHEFFTRNKSETAFRIKVDFTIPNRNRIPKRPHTISQVRGKLVVKITIMCSKTTSYEFRAWLWCGRGDFKTPHLGSVRIADDEGSGDLGLRRKTEKRGMGHRAEKSPSFIINLSRPSFSMLEPTRNK